MTKYVARDDGGQWDLDATTDREARDEAIDALADADWAPCARTWWARATVYAADDDGVIVRRVGLVRVRIDPDEPPCAGGRDHDWRQAACRGHGGGVIVTERCRHCQQRMVTDTWATDPVDGTQGHEAVEYFREEEEEEEDD